jgi:hypothetical protein
MPTTTDNPSHFITYIEDVTREFPASVNEDGDIVLVGEADVLDIHDNSIWCSNCGRLGSDEFAAHGISDEWQVM